MAAPGDYNDHNSNCTRKFGMRRVLQPSSNAENLIVGNICFLYAPFLHNFAMQISSLPDLCFLPYNEEYEQDMSLRLSETTSSPPDEISSSKVKTLDPGAYDVSC